MQHSMQYFTAIETGCCANSKRGKNSLFIPRFSTRNDSRTGLFPILRPMISVIQTRLTEKNLSTSLIYPIKNYRSYSGPGFRIPTDPPSPRSHITHMSVYQYFFAPDSFPSAAFLPCPSDISPIKNNMPL